VNKVLIIQTAFLGDVILATPVAEEMKRLFPNSSIDILVRKGNESLLSNNPNINDILVLDKSKPNKRLSIKKTISRIRNTQYDLVLNLHRFGSSGYITMRSKAKKKYGFKKNPYSIFFTKRFDHLIGDSTHEVERNLSLIKEFGAKSKIRPTLFPDDSAYEYIAQYCSTNFVTIAPASVWKTKEVPNSKWAELIGTIPKDTAVYLLGGAGDYGKCEELIDSADHPLVTNLAGKLSLLQSAALMKKSTMNHVNDSGPLHLASAMNAPTTAYYCSTVPEFGFGPLSDDSEVKQVEGLACKPCGLHGHKECPKGHFNCSEIEMG
jgi:heptosyltransferase-2